MKNLRIILAVIFAAAIGLSALSLLLPIPADAEISQFYSPVATSVVLVDVFLAAGSAVLFLMALKNFKPELKPAYRLLAFSTLAVSIGLLVLPYIEYYGLWENLLLNMGSYLQYLVGAPLMFFGILMFYKRVGFGRRGVLIAALTGVLVFSVIHPFLPYDGAWDGFGWGRTEYNLFKIVTIIPFVLYGIAAYMTLRMLRRTGREYRSAFTWITVALVLYTINALGIILIEVLGYEVTIPLFGHDFGIYTDRLYEAPAILGDLAFVIAGYCFAAIGRPKVALEKGQKISSIDIVVYAAAKVSDNTKIDNYLDDMRTITAGLSQSGGELKPQDQQTLRDVYLKIEDFLVTGDPLRSFKKEDLRADISHRFALDTQSTETFWPMLPQS